INPKIPIPPNRSIVYSKVKIISIVKYVFVSMNIRKYDKAAHDPAATPRLLYYFHFILRIKYLNIFICDIYLLGKISLINIQGKVLIEVPNKEIPLNNNVGNQGVDLIPNKIIKIVFIETDITVKNLFPRLSNSTLALPIRVPDTSLYRTSSRCSAVIISGFTQPRNQHRAFLAFSFFPLAINHIGDSGI
ncbi:hypothetical protein AGLY_008393, partial [Aphis glycines]